MKEGKKTKLKKEKKEEEKKNRWWVGGVLLISTFFTLVFWFLGEKDQKVRKTFSFSSPVKLPEFKKTSPQNQKGTKSGEILAKKVEQLLANQPGEWAIWVEELEGGFSWGINQREKFPAASLIKLPVVATVYRLAEKGEVSLGEEVVLKEEDKREGAGNLYLKPAGTKITIKELVFLALNHSDNTAFTILRRLVSDQKIKATLKELGMRDTSLEENLTTAADVALFFKKLYRGEVTRLFREEFLEALTGTWFEERIPAGVPQGIKVAHKVGTEKAVVNDAGIVFVPEKPFVLVILAQNTPLKKGEELMVNLTREIYWFLLSG